MTGMPIRSPLVAALIALALTASFIAFSAKGPPRPLPATAGLRGGASLGQRRRGVAQLRSPGHRPNGCGFQTGPGNLDQIRLVRRLPDIAASSVTVYRYLPTDTDLSEFFALGKPALDFAFADGVERYHTAEDDAGHLDPGSIQQEGATALGLTCGFGHGPLPRPTTGNAVFFELPVVGLVVYPESGARPIGVGSILLTILAIVRVGRRERRWFLGLALGLVAMVVAGALGGAAAHGLGLALIGLGASTLGWAVIRRWGSAATAGLGPLIVWTGLAAVASWKLPGVSFVVTWPAKKMIESTSWAYSR